jgi:hypothetical protein
MPSLTAVVSSLTLARNNQELKGVVSGYLRLLLSRSERFLEERITTRGWTAQHGVRRAAKTFWISIFGTALVHQAGWIGTYEDVDIAAGLSLSAD